MSTFNLKLTSQQSPCNDKDYYFKAFVEDNFTKVGQSVQTFVTGGVGPFTWTADGDGTFAEETTAGKINTLTCDTMPSDSMLTFTVEDSCGNVVEGAISVWSYNPGEGCSATYVPFAVVGTETPTVGTVYTAEGGQAPYTFGFDRGTIDPVTGEILSLDTCGASGSNHEGYVTATDAFGTVTSFYVRLPNGIWKTVGWDPTYDLKNTSACNQTADGSDDYTCDKTLPYSCDSSAGEYRSIDGYCKIWRLYEKCDPSHWRELIYWCKPINAWVCP